MRTSNGKPILPYFVHFFSANKFHHGQDYATFDETQTAMARWSAEHPHNSANFETRTVSARDSG